MGFGLDRDAKDYRDERSAPARCVRCERVITCGILCTRCRAEQAAEQEREA
jgi:hypothetical protein